MRQPYPECSECIATPWCKLYSGEVTKTSATAWCQAKFRLDKALALSDIPLEYHEANLSNYTVDKDNREVFEFLKPYVDNIVGEVDKGTNFFFYHTNPGSGKTYNACVLLNQFIYKTCLTERFDFENPLALFVEYPSLMHRLRYKRDDEETEKYVERVKSVPLLLIDDIGSGTTSEFTIEQTYIILNHRFNHRLSTIITSNLSIQELRQPNVLAPRNVSRILARCVGKEIGGRDRRMDWARGSK